jgi:hypothetical protein
MLTKIFCVIVIPLFTWWIICNRKKASKPKPEWTVTGLEESALSAQFTDRERVKRSGRLIFNQNTPVHKIVIFKRYDVTV